jgi:hypothetical protein
MIGGTFSHPAEKYPAIFKYEILETYPYLLPGLIAAGVALAGAIFGYFYLEEVCLMPSKHGEKVVHESARRRYPVNAREQRKKS